MTSLYSLQQGPDNAHGIMYHHFHGSGHPVVQGSIDADQLAEMIEFLGGRNRILDPQDWLERSRAGRLGPNDLCLTFDDSLMCQKDVAVPVLNDLGYKGFFFIYSSVFQGGLEPLEIYRAFRTRCFDDVDDFYEKFYVAVEESQYRGLYSSQVKEFSDDVYMAEYPLLSATDKRFRYVRDQILGPAAYGDVMDGMIDKSGSLEELSSSLWMNNEDLLEMAKDGHELGLHSYTHPTVLGDLSPLEQESEYSRNIEHLEELLGVRPVSLSHPCNSYTGDTLDVLRKLGLTMGFRANIVEKGQNNLEFVREDHSNIINMMKGTAR